LTPTAAPVRHCGSKPLCAYSAVIAGETPLSHCKHTKWLDRSESRWPLILKGFYSASIVKNCSFFTLFNPRMPLTSAPAIVLCARAGGGVDQRGHLPHAVVGI